MSGAALAVETYIKVEYDLPYFEPEKGETAAAKHQLLDLYWTDNSVAKPVVIYVHGGGWAFGDKSEVHQKPSYFVSQGMHFVSMNYRLRWEYSIYHQVADVASVVNWVVNNAATYGFDPDKIILMGHGAGAHLVSLVATDEKFLRAIGLSLKNILSVVAIDTAGFDIRRQIESSGLLDARLYSLIFGDKESVWVAASPISHVAAGKNIPGFALLYVVGSETTVPQTKAFAKKLSDASIDAIIIPGNEKTNQSIDEEIGTEGDQPTLALMTFIRAKL